MNLGATIVGIVIVGLCIIPFILISANSRKKKERLLQGLFGLAQKNKGEISRYDLWNNSTIGIDDTAHTIFFTRKVKETETLQMIHLAEVQKCRVINSGRAVRQTVGNHQVIEKLELEFAYWDKVKTATVLEFYNTDSDSLTLTGELQLAEKWNKIVNDCLSAIPLQK